MPATKPLAAYPAAIWEVRKDVQLLDQPVAFLGSEGEMGVVASTVADFLWLLAGGLGPCEAVTVPSEKPDNPHFTEFAMMHAPESKKTALEVLARAKADFPDFEPRMLEICR